MAQPHPFHSPRTHGFVRVAAATPVVKTAAAKLPSNFFATKIKPMIDSKCVDCHGSTKQKGDLRLDSVAAIKKGAGHPVVVAGDLELSSFYQRLITPDQEDLMPPPAKAAENTWPQ